jgi:hypothetical protein
MVNTPLQINNQRLLSQLGYIGRLWQEGWAQLGGTAETAETEGEPELKRGTEDMGRG